MSRDKRILAIDAARGLALVGMFSVHILDGFRENFTPTPSWVVFSGRSAALFALLAGVSLTLATRRVDWTDPGQAGGAKMAVAARAGIIGVVGLLLAYVNNDSDFAVYVILPYYALAFVCALPLLRASSPVVLLAALVAAFIGPALALAAAATVGAPVDASPSLLWVLTTFPPDVFNLLAFTGPYPVVCFMAYVAVGIVVGRLALDSARVCARLLAGGVALAGCAYGLSTYFMLRLGGLDSLVANANFLDATQGRSYLLWDGMQALDSPWELVERGSHSNSVLELLHNIGCALAVIGLFGLILRLKAVRSIFTPLVAAGAMPFTLYALHVCVISLPFVEDHEALLFWTSVGGSLLAATLWRLSVGQGPLEHLVAFVARKARIWATATPSAPS